MTTLTYNLTRQQAADRLGISTRTIDRYVKDGRLSYKKVANKVILAAEEIHSLGEDFSLLHQHDTAIDSSREMNSGTTSGLQLQKVQQPTDNQSVREFADILQQKDAALEEKNQLIYVLQRKIGELESKMQHMIALPDHSAQTQLMQEQVASLTAEKNKLVDEIKKEKLWNAVYIGLVMIAAAMIIFFAFFSF